MKVFRADGPTAARPPVASIPYAIPPLRLAAFSAVLPRRAEPLLFERASGRRGELAHEPIGELPGDRQLAVALELLDRRARVGAENSGRLDRTIAEIAQRALH